jgi:protein-S-isoprenylcysteine O-methyltransferase Ste14
MANKLLNTLLFLVLAFVVPLLGKPTLLQHYKIVILALAAVLVFMPQPGFKAEEAKAQKERDKNTVWLILLSSLLAVVLPVIEWAYFHPERHHAYWVWIGILMLLVGVGFRNWGIGVLGKQFTPTVQLQTSHQLVKSGPYAFVRHPGYFGAFLAILGCSVVLESWISLPLAALFMGYAYAKRIGQEEKALTEYFGESYRAYQQETRKFIPFLW